MSDDDVLQEGSMTARQQESKEFLRSFNVSTTPTELELLYFFTYYMK
jgi:hypothetical protein